MQAGQLRERVTIRRPLVTTNAAGQDVYRYTAPIITTDVVWASVRNVSQNKGGDGEQLPAGTERYEVRMRYTDAVAYDVRLEWNGLTLEVVGIENPRNVNHELRLTCEVVDL